MPLDILYEDNHILALNKPAGIPTQPSPAAADSLETRAKAFIKQRDGKPGNVFLHAVHRLDSQASGIVLFAKSQKALSRLSAALRNHQLRKEYIALVEGSSPPPLGTVITFLAHGNHRADVVKPSDPGAQRAELIITSCLQQEAHQWAVHVSLITGRYHQIRAQLSANGHPVVGDVRYGSTTAFSGRGIALHHTRLAFPHPTLGKEICLRCNPPF